MKEITLILLSFLLAAFDLGATSTLDAASKVYLAQHSRAAARRAPATGNQVFQAFVSVDDDSTVIALRKQGVKVHAAFNGFVVADVTAQSLATVTAQNGVRHISLARHLELCNDIARTLSRVGPLHETVSQVVPLMGKDVIVGMIDTGIDFNHLNLCDENGRTRVRAVYLPMDSTGIAPVVKGDTLPGSCYETPGQIALLTTDYPGSSHGTHTTGTAAGSCRDNGWYGVAPEADLVLCGIPAPELTDANIVDGVAYIFDYADRVGKPCVINMSIGSNGGPNDGTSFLCRAFDEMTGPSRICIVAAGNDGSAPICLHATIEGVGDTVTTLLRNQWGGLQRKGFVSTWSDDVRHHRTRLVIINRATGVMEYASPFLGQLPEDSVFSINSEDDMEFARYYDGEVLFANAMEPGYDNDGQLVEFGRYHSYWHLDATSVQAGHLLGLQYVADERVDLTGWTTRECYFYTFGLDGMTGGDTSGSISDMATTDNVISVGAYCSRDNYMDKTGSIVEVNNCYPGDIAYFSSYGPDENGVTRPDICAPGMILMSSASRYDTISNQQQWPASLIKDGMEYPYYANQGTSMSAPVVTGAIALMLQVNPMLGPQEVRESLRRSAYTDAPVHQGNPEQWGSGKLDAAAALRDVLDSSFLRGDVNNDKEVGIADIMALTGIILDGMSGYDAGTLLRADVNRDCEIQIADINALIDLILNKRL